MGTKNEPLKAKYLGNGVIRLYRDPELMEESLDLPSLPSGKSAMSLESSYENLEDLQQGSEPLQNTPQTTLLSILAIPSYFTATDVLGFIGEETLQRVSHVRIIRLATLNRYLVLLAFRDAKYARRFRRAFNGRHFNSMEPETCHVVHVSSVVYRRGEAVDDPFQDDPEIAPEPLPETGTKPIPPPTPRLQELPTCPVCLERMDASVTGLLIIPCQHTFHCQCLSKWQDDSCPICRYSSKPRSKAVSSETETTDRCTSCGITDNLWICLVCGNIACGRYNHAHAVEHYRETGHCFSMDMTSQRIWDYASDSYVHRLLMSESDGKLVELPSRDSSTDEDTSKNKNGSQYVEYSHILVSQLESQREYYEQKLSELSDSISALRVTNKQLESEKSEMEKKIPALIDSSIETKMEKMMADMTKKNRKIDELSKKYLEEKSLTTGMMNKITALQKLNLSFVEKLKEKDKEIEELKEQAKDLMFFLESQEKFKNAPEDVKEGTVVMTHNGSQKKLKKKKKKVPILPPEELKIKKPEPQS